MAWQALRTAGSLKQISCRVAGCEYSMEEASIFYQRSRCCPDHASSHSISPTLLGGATEPSRFCQKCGRFHSLTNFDGDKKSCRKQLQEHNARRKQARLAQEKTQLQAAAAVTSDPSVEEEDIKEDEKPPPKSISKKKGPRRKPPPTPTAAVDHNQPLEKSAFLPPSGDILRSNWSNLFSTSQISVKPAAMPAQQPLESDALVRLIALRPQAQPASPTAAPKTRDGVAVVGGISGDSELSNAFDRSYSLEDGPVVALPNGTLDDDLDGTPPLPSGDDWWSPPKQRYGAEPDDDDLMETASPPTMVVDALMIEPEQQQGDTGVIKGRKQPLSPRFAAALAAASFQEYGEHYSKLPYYMYQELYDRIKGKM